MESITPAPQDPPSTEPSESALCVRYFGRRDDAGFHRLLGMLRFFHGDCRTEVYLDQTGERIRLPQEYWIERTDPVLRLIAERMGIDNIALV
jgi:hypothetical protein